MKGHVHLSGVTLNQQCASLGALHPFPGPVCLLSLFCPSHSAGQTGTERLYMPCPEGDTVLHNGGGYTIRAYFLESEILISFIF